MSVGNRIVFPQVPKLTRRRPEMKRLPSSNSRTFQVELTGRREWERHEKPPTQESVMPLFRIKGQSVARISPREQRIKEESIHRTMEENLSEFFSDLRFVAHKPRIGGKEFDTLALHTGTNAPVIVEYKRERDRGVVEQVDLYYVKLKHNKSDVMILLQKQNVIEDLGEVDFENPQIVVVAREFTPEQREILSLKSGYLRLFRYQLYEGELISLEEVEPLGSTILAKTRDGRGAPAGPYGIDHFGMKAEVEKLYERLDKGIISLDARVKPGKVNKFFIGYGATGSYFCQVSPRVHFLKLHIKCRRRPPRLKALRIRRNPSNWTMTHTFDIRSRAQIAPALRVIKMALEDSM